MNERQKPRTACPDYADRLVDLSDGELSGGADAEVAAHVATCDGCRAELGRLNASLSALQHGIVAASMISRPRHRRAVRRTVLIGVGATAAAVVLAVGIAGSLKAPASGRGEGPDNPSIAQTLSPHSAPAPNTLTTGQGFESGATLSADEALRRIALLEQQARLETSLALMPDDPWFADQRAANEALLATLRRATSAAGSVDHPPHPTPGKKGTL